jgi:hypothetical protein
MRRGFNSRIGAGEFQLEQHPMTLRHNHGCCSRLPAPNFVMIDLTCILTVPTQTLSRTPLPT